MGVSSAQQCLVLSQGLTTGCLGKMQLVYGSRIQIFVNWFERYPPSLPFRSFFLLGIHHHSPSTSSQKLDPIQIRGKPAPWADNWCLSGLHESVKPFEGSEYFHNGNTARVLAGCSVNWASVNHSKACTDFTSFSYSVQNYSFPAAKVTERASENTQASY